MAEQRSRMTYEQQRVQREQRVERTADRFSAENYGSGRSSGNAPRRRTAQAQPSRRASSRNADGSRQAPQRRSASRGATAQGSTQRRQRPQAGSDSSQAQRSARQAESPQGARDRLSRGNYRGGAAAATKPLPIVKIAIVAVLLVAVVLAVQLCSSITPITVTVNGSQYELRGAKTVQTAIKESGLPINPGDFISLRGNVLEKSAGHPFSATVNDTQTADPNFRLRDGDTITVTDGEDIVEEHDVVENPIPYGATITGVGSIHEITPGVEGVMETWTGKVSGETVDRQTVDPINVTCSQYNLNTGAKKYIAITFDDGPSSDYTAAVLDILAQNDAKATFFCIGTNVEAYPDLVKREHDEGHQVCTHSYDHADPVGGTNIGFMDAAGQIDEVVRGQGTITNVIGGEPSRVVRLPGGNMDEAVVLNIQPYVDYEVGWNIDTVDWTLPGAEAIYQAIIGAEPGDVILCHDGGGDRSETVEALSRAVPYLKQKGFEFVTMDELLAVSTHD